MKTSESFLQALKQAGIDFYAGVPDSVLQAFTQALAAEPNHIIAANEGAALTAAAAYHLATGKIGLVYLQNSGVGNLINPLTSLADASVYGCPTLLLIGWRGRPGGKDEPQHFRMGSITLPLLELLSVPVLRLEKESDATAAVMQAIEKSSSTNHPVALLVEEGYFEKAVEQEQHIYPLSAQMVIQSLINRASRDDVFLCTTGKTGRLFYSINQKSGNKIIKYFLNVGAMGHLSSLAAVFSRFQASRIFVLDGDGSLLMHLGAFVANGFLMQDNLHYLVLNNGCHQSVGGQATVGFQTRFADMASLAGFTDTIEISTASGFESWLGNISLRKEFADIRINTEMPDNLPRPENSPGEEKNQLQKALGL